MNVNPPTSKMENFESELIRRFFHPKSYFYYCLSNRIESLAHSASETSAATAVNTINRLVTNLVSAGDAYAEWKQLVRQPGLEALHLFLSEKIVWLSRQNFSGEALRQAIDSVATALFEKLTEMLQQESSKQKIDDFLEGDLSLLDAPFDLSQEEFPEDSQAAGETDKVASEDFSEILTDELGDVESPGDSVPESASNESEDSTDSPDIDTESLFEAEAPSRTGSVSPEIESSDETEIQEKSQNAENALFSRFKEMSLAEIDAIIQQLDSIEPPEQIRKRFRLFQVKLNELKSLSMIQGYEIVEDFATKLLQLMPTLENSSSNHKQAYLELAKDTLHLMLNWLNDSTPEAQIRAQFQKITDFNTSVPLIDSSEKKTKKTRSTESEPGANASEKKIEAPPDPVTPQKLVWPEESASEENFDVGELLIDSFAENSSDSQTDFSESSQENISEKSSDEEAFIEAVPVDESNPESDVPTIDLESETETIESDADETLIHLPGEDDLELKQLINDILTSKNTDVSENSIEPSESGTASESNYEFQTAHVNEKQITEISETDLFKSEAALYLKIIEDALSNLQEEPHNLTFLEDIELSAYSIKRLAQKMGFETLSRLPEQIENSMADLAQKRKKVSREIIQNIAEAIAFLGNVEKNDLTAKEKLMSILNKLNEREKELIY